LLLAAAQRAERRATPLLQREPLEEALRVVRAPGGEQLDRLAYPEPLRKRGALELAADLRSQRRRLPHRVEAETRR
jgi:hypothetical protein